MSYPSPTADRMQLYSSRIKTIQRDQMFTQPDEYKLGLFDESRVAQVSLMYNTKVETLICGDPLIAFPIAEGSNYPVMNQSTSTVSVSGIPYALRIIQNAISRTRDIAFTMKYLKAQDDLHLNFLKIRDGICVKLLNSILGTTVVPTDNYVTYDYTGDYNTPTSKDLNGYKLTSAKLQKAQEIAQYLNRGQGEMSLITSPTGKTHLLQDEQYKNTSYTTKRLPGDVNGQSQITNLGGQDILSVNNIPFPKAIPNNLVVSSSDVNNVMEIVSLDRRDVTVGTNVFTVETGFLISTSANVDKRAILVGAIDSEITTGVDIANGNSHSTSWMSRIGATLVLPEKNIIPIEYVIGVKAAPSNPAAPRPNVKPSGK